MKILPPLGPLGVYRLLLRRYSDELPLYDADIEDLMNNDYKINPGEATESWHHDHETGLPTSIEYKDQDKKDFCLASDEKGRITKRELDRIPQTQRKLARILDKRLYESFNEEIKKIKDIVIEDKNKIGYYNNNA